MKTHTSLILSMVLFNHHSVDAAGLRAQALGDSGNHGHTDLSLEAWR